jgi:methyltransferase (TIGR00027 family)
MATFTTTSYARAPSRTAEGVAIQRALHLKLDSPPHILTDSVAANLLSAGALEEAASLDSEGSRLMRYHCCLRSRYAEDKLLAAVEQRGVSRLVILGAGLDTLAYRLPQALQTGLEEVVEVDHPASQRDKLSRLAAAGVALPPNLRLLPVDFEAGSSLASSLAPSPRPSFFICLGVLMYIPPSAVQELFKYVASLPPGSEIVFSFMSSLPLSPGATSISWPSSWAGRGVEQQAAAVGEPFLSKYTPDELSELLLSVGFSEVHFLDRAEAFSSYPSPLCTNFRTNIGRAIV